MCTPAKCRTCGNTTWKGCGRHVDQVMRSVPKDQRCTCSPEDRKPMGLFAQLFARR
jgi:hypothetical protein